jgi:hypothetical protein
VNLRAGVNTKHRGGKHDVGDGEGSPHPTGANAMDG